MSTDVPTAGIPISDALTDTERGARGATRSSVRRDRQFVAFACGGESFLVPIQVVKEVIKVPPITPVPQMPEWIEGVINLRGTILPLIDLRRRLGFTITTGIDESLVVVVHVEQRLIGFIVDAVDRVLAVDGAQISEPPEAIAARTGPHLVGLVQTKERLHAIIDPARVLTADEVATAAASVT